MKGFLKALKGSQTPETCGASQPKTQQALCPDPFKAIPKPEKAVHPRYYTVVLKAPNPSASIRALTGSTWCSTPSAMTLGTDFGIFFLCPTLQAKHYH